MYNIKKIAVLCIIAMVIVLSAGCTDNGADQNTATGNTPQTTTETPYPTSGSDREFTIGDTLPSDIKVELSASPVDEKSILLSYTLDLSSMGSAMKQEGWDVLLTAYAYNPDKMERDFSVNSYNDIISGGIPYKTSRIRLYPSNVYPDKVEISSNPDNGMTLDTEDYYIYGIVLREA